MFSQPGGLWAYRARASSLAPLRGCLKSPDSVIFHRLCFPFQLPNSWGEPWSAYRVLICQDFSNILSHRSLGRGPADDSHHFFSLAQWSLLYCRQVRQSSACRFRPAAVAPNTLPFVFSPHAPRRRGHLVGDPVHLLGRPGAEEAPRSQALDGSCRRMSVVRTLARR